MSSKNERKKSKHLYILHLKEKKNRNILYLLNIQHNLYREIDHCLLFYSYDTYKAKINIKLCI